MNNTTLQAVRLSLVALSAASFAAHAQSPSSRAAAHDDDTFDEIIVEGAALDRTVAELAQPTDVLTGDQLIRQQSASIGETISNQLGVSSSYFGPVASRPVIRGQFGERVLVLSNSLDSLDASALSEDHAASVNSLLVERVEIVRGPATLLYGSGAAGGLINVIDDRINETPLLAPLSGAVSLGTDSATGRESIAAKIAAGTDQLAFHLDLFRTTTDNIEIPGFAESALFRQLEEAEGGEEEEEGEEEAFGIVENTDSETDGGAAAVSYTGDNGYIGISVSQYNSNYGIPGHHEHEEEEGGVEEEEEEEIIRIDMEQRRVDLKGEYRFDEARKIRFSFVDNDYMHVELEGDEIGTLFDTQGQDARVEYRHGNWGPLEGAIGLQLRRVDFDAVGEEAFVPPSETDQTSVFIFEEWANDSLLTWQGSARLERQEITTPGQPKYSDTAFGASVGAIWAATDDQTLSVNLSFTERHPNSTELYANGPHIAVERFEVGSVAQGNGVLDKEVSTNLDVTWRGELGGIEWAVTAFENNIHDYILLSPTAAEEDGFQVFEFGQTDARLRGMEAEARIEIFDRDYGHLHTRLFTDFVRGEDTNTGSDLPRLPPLRYGAALHYVADRFEGSLEARFHDDQDRTAPNELPTDSYWLLSAEASYSLAEPNVLLFVRGSNLTDEDARQHTSPLKDTVPLPGRSVQLGVRYDF